MHFIIEDSNIVLASLTNLLSDDSTLELSQTVINKINKCRNYLNNKIAKEDAVYYGINTGFGSLYNVIIEKENLTKLQENLVKSHACGIGDLVRKDIVKLMLFLKIKNIALGHSGVSLEITQRLVDMFNSNILPVIYEQGSLGASGDLAPLAHLSLPLLGLGEVYYQNDKFPTHEVWKKMGWNALELQAKEGLALLNGTQFMNAHAIWSLIEAEKIKKWSEIIAAISIDAFDCSYIPFHTLIQSIRNQDGQKIVAQNILKWLEGSWQGDTIKKHTQDPYAFRCIPQVHGASYDAINYVYRIAENEINAVTDNPLIFPDEDLIMSGGNFHGQPLAISMDFLAIALAELGSISERRTYQLISGQRDLPPFLVSKPGLNSGLMIPQYTAASIVSQNKQLCTPASIDSIISSNGQEDHVSMGANAGTKLVKVVDNVKKILAIELLNASQALSFRTCLTSKNLMCIIENFRTIVPLIEDDRLFHDDIVKAISFIENYQFES